LDDLTTITNDAETAKSALDQVGVVPNPYYAYSGYEKAGVENVVKFVNLPNRCTVNIYTMNGTLIRTLRKDDSSTYLNWDLKNQALIPIASGMYIIHVDAPGVGERILKWFGVMRPIDLDAY
ncbi:MAG TPA: T9SS type A sorting domain-containing protein, partial [Bacteroidia bacterium]|nr:T9SS type A sorting domain-containing protein [Bacteroidia bacterium]